jgi:hypothetical protein
MSQPQCRLIHVAMIRKTFSKNALHNKYILKIFNSQEISIETTL